MESDILILPGTLEFEQTLATPPPDWREVAWHNGGTYAFVADSGSGLLRAVNGVGCQEYLLGGEYEERLAFMGEEDEGLADDLNGVDEVFIDW